MLCPAQEQMRERKFNPALSMGEIGFTAGMYTNVNRERLGEGTAYSLDYGEFNIFNGLGFRGGLSYIEGLDDGIDVISMPLKFALRSRLPRRMTPVERIQSALISQIGYYRPNPAAAILSQLSMRVEISVGLTPGYISGDGFHSSPYSSSYGNYEDGISVKTRFMLTADAGSRLSIRIWRFNIVFAGYYHYLLTNNYRRDTTLSSFDGRLSRSYFSLNLGLSFML